MQRQFAYFKHILFPGTGCKKISAYNTMCYICGIFGYKNGIISRIKRKVANYATNQFIVCCIYPLSL